MASPFERSSGPKAGGLTRPNRTVNRLDVASMTGSFYSSFSDLPPTPQNQSRTDLHGFLPVDRDSPISLSYDSQRLPWNGTTGACCCGLVTSFYHERHRAHSRILDDGGGDDDDDDEKADDVDGVTEFSTCSHSHSRTHIHNDTHTTILLPGQLSSLPTAERRTDRDSTITNISDFLHQSGLVEENSSPTEVTSRKRPSWFRRFSSFISPLPAPAAPIRHLGPIAHPGPAVHPDLATVPEPAVPLKRLPSIKLPGRINRHISSHRYPVFTTPKPAVYPGLPTRKPVDANPTVKKMSGPGGYPGGGWRTQDDDAFDKYYNQTNNSAAPGSGSAPTRPTDGAFGPDEIDMPTGPPSYDNDVREPVNAPVKTPKPTVYPELPTRKPVDANPTDKKMSGPGGYPGGGWRTQDDDAFDKYYNQTNNSAVPGYGSAPTRPTDGAFGPDEIDMPTGPPSYDNDVREPVNAPVQTDRRVAASHWLVEEAGTLEGYLEQERRKTVDQVDSSWPAIRTDGTRKFIERESYLCNDMNLGLKIVEWCKEEKKAPRPPPEPMKKREVYGPWMLLLLCAIILLLFICYQIFTKGSPSAAGAIEWANLVGFPALPLGSLAISSTRLNSGRSGCIQPSSMWSCAVPVENQESNKPALPDAPRLRFYIRYDQSTSLTGTDPKTGRKKRAISNTGSNLLIKADPYPPELEDREFLGRTTDNVTIPYAGEDTPFYMSLVPINSDPSTEPESDVVIARSIDDTVIPTHTLRSISDPSLTVRAETNGSVTTSIPLRSSLPDPPVDSTGAASPAVLIPEPKMQPLRLFNRGLSDEHYGFYIYYDRSIFLSGSNSQNTTDLPGAAPLDRTGGSAQKSATRRCTWAMTRLIVQIWTRAGTTKSIMTNSTLPTDGNPFPYPVTVTIDRHGGNQQDKSVYCYDLTSGGMIKSGSGKFQIEDRSWGGVSINPALGPFDKTIVSYADGGPGGMDGGSGGCSCEWVSYAPEA